MNNQRSSAKVKTGWRKVLKPGILIILGILIAFPLFSIGYYTMVRTSTPQFCASCHEIQFAYNTWKTSTHANNSQGFVADCMDCHLPAPQETYEFFYSKTIHGLKDLIRRRMEISLGQPLEDGQPLNRRNQADLSQRLRMCLGSHFGLIINLEEVQIKM